MPLDRGVKFKGAARKGGVRCFCRLTAVKRATVHAAEGVNKPIHMLPANPNVSQMSPCATYHS